MEGVLEKEVICFTQYSGVALRRQIYNHLLAQLWNWLLSKAPFRLSGYVGGGRIVFKPLENMGVRINYFCNNVKVHK